MTVEEFLQVIENSDRVRIEKDGQELFTGYMYSLQTDEQYDFKGCEIKKFRAVPEIRHKKWWEKGLMQPLMPDEMPEYSFSDLQMSLYYTIHI